MSLAYLAAAIDAGSDPLTALGSRQAQESLPVLPDLREDAELLVRLRGGDEAAFDTLVATHARQLIAFGITLLGAREDAEDIVQDVLLWIWDRRTTFTLSGSLRTYLLTAVRRRALNVLAHRAVQARHAIVVADENTHDGSPIDTTSPGIDDATLWRAVRQLPARWQEGITLRYVAGLPYAEVGRVLGVAEPAARMLVRRAVEALRRDLAG